MESDTAPINVGSSRDARRAANIEKMRRLIPEKSAAN
jgi:hypothetical protein